jgi:phosphoribosylaminoimidazolecarboxamide formyltransferase/IMP cyclohydrolase
MDVRYGMNPHQAARVSGPEPVRVLAGAPSFINLLDALNAWQLASQTAAATGRPAAASFKHVSPAGLAVAGRPEDTAEQTRPSGTGTGSLTSAYRRARDADPKSSFGDMIAVSGPVDAELAAFLATVVSDGIIAPGFEPGTLAVLAAKKRGTFLVLEADPAYEPPSWEQREVFGLTLAQERDVTPLTAGLLSVAAGPPLPAGAVQDALVGLSAVRYTQSNSVALVLDGVTLGIGAGQQSRVDCVRLAASKAATWWLRRHPLIAGLPAVAGMSRQDRINWQVRMADADMTPGQLTEFGRLFPGVAPGVTGPERADWLAQLAGVTLVSDGYLPFTDNIEHASRIGVRYVIEPGGSSRAAEVEQACCRFGMTLVRTGLRLFHH